jgi:hypothetical protein
LQVTLWNLALRNVHTVELKGCTSITFLLLFPHFLKYILKLIICDLCSSLSLDDLLHLIEGFVPDASEYFL